jgi:hypothetical protein
MVAQTLFEHSCDVHRMRTVAGTGGAAPQVGDVGYSGGEQTTTPTDVEGEDVLYTGVTCAIQSKTAGRTRSSLLPADIVYRPSWTIYIPASEVPKNGIRDRDILIDDDGYRYGVAAAMWTSLGWNLECVRLEA